MIHIVGDETDAVIGAMEGDARQGSHQVVTSGQDDWGSANVWKSA